MVERAKCGFMGVCNSGSRSLHLPSRVSGSSATGELGGGSLYGRLSSACYKTAKLGLRMTSHCILVHARWTSANSADFSEARSAANAIVSSLPLCDCWSGSIRAAYVEARGRCLHGCGRGRGGIVGRDRGACVQYVSSDTSLTSLLWQTGAPPEPSQVHAGTWCAAAFMDRYRLRCRR